jgi:DNA-binding transcriptional regulator LsrR (DeoR family)
MRQRRIGHLSLSKMTRLLMTRPVSYDDIAAQTGLTRQTVGIYVRAMRQEGICHVADWRQDKQGHMTVRCWALGFRPDKGKHA